MSLRIRFTRLNPTHHRFEAIRADGTRETLDLETRSFLMHDLVHYVVESEAELRASFYGTLAGGGPYDAMSSPMTGEAAQTESVVGPLQTAVKGEVDADAFVARSAAYRLQTGAGPIPWLTADMIARAVARLRKIEGRWRATPFGETMELEFPPAA